MRGPFEVDQNSGAIFASESILDHDELQYQVYWIVRTVFKSIVFIFIFLSISNYVMIHL